MSEERIVIVVDDAELDMAIAKLKQAISLSTRTPAIRDLTKSPRTAMKEWRELEKVWSTLVAKEPGLLEKFGTADLPSINRNLRVILGQIPGMRQLIQYYFRVSWLQKSVGKFVEAGTVMPLVLTLLATAIILFRQAEMHQRRAKLQAERYELYVRKAKSWTHDEFTKGTKEWESYARSLPG